MRILVLCTGNSCRSQMAEGFIRHFLPEAEVFSAGTKPAEMVHPKATEVMREAGIHISKQEPELIDKYLAQSFDYVITVCDDAYETCPFFSGKVKKRMHISFEDPARATGTEEEIMGAFRKVRDEIKETFLQFTQSL